MRKPLLITDHVQLKFDFPFLDQETKNISPTLGLLWTSDILFQLVVKFNEQNFVLVFLETGFRCQSTQINIQFSTGIVERAKHASQGKNKSTHARMARGG